MPGLYFVIPSKQRNFASATLRGVGPDGGTPDPPSASPPATAGWGACLASLSRSAPSGQLKNLRNTRITIIIMTTEGNKITAEPGKVLRRISDGFIYGNEVYLGFTHYLNGELLDEPLLELPEHFEEIEKPELDNEVELILEQ